MKSSLALDSGAFSLYNKYAKRGNIELSDFSFYKSEKFNDYLAAYVKRVKENPYPLDWYVTVDVIFNPEMTWDIWQQLRKLGLNPLPVVHFGEDPKWLRRYMDEVDYIGLGGAASLKQTGAIENERWVTNLFEIITGKNGKPTHKIHGFALTQYDILKKFAWHSVDSTTCWRAASNGSFIIPQPTGKGFDYAGRPYWFPCTEGRSDNASNVWKLGEAYQRVIRDYIEQFGFTLEQTREDYMARNVISYNYYYRLSQILSKERDYPFRFYVSGRPAGCSNDAIKTLLDHMQRTIKVEVFDYLGTYFDIKTMDIFNLHLKGRNENKRPASRIKARLPRTA